MHRSELAAKVSKKVNAPEKGLHELESKAERKAKEARMEAEGAFESVQLPEDIQLSTFQKQFGEDKTVGQALRRLLKQKKSKNFTGLTIWSSSVLKIYLKYHPQKELIKNNRNILCAIL